MRIAFVLLTGALVAGICAPAHGYLQWHQDSTPIETLVFDLNESVTLQLYETDPIARFYDTDTMGGPASEVADITTVEPLFLAGHYGSATPSPAGEDWWTLHAAWDYNQAWPISVWGDHWDVTIHATAQGDCYFSSGMTGDYTTLHVTVVPEPSALTLLGIGLFGVLGCGFRRRADDDDAGVHTR